MMLKKSIAMGMENYWTVIRHFINLGISTVRLANQYVSRYGLNITIVI